MSSDVSEKTLVTLARALRTAKLEAIVIGNSASMLNGAPVTTQDIGLLIRDTRTNRRKLARFADEIGGSVPMPVSESSRVEWIEGRLAVPVEIHYDRISGGLTFSSVRSRAQVVAVGDEKLRVAALADVIRSKQAAGRPKDRAVLPNPSRHPRGEEEAGAVGDAVLAGPRKPHPRAHVMRGNVTIGGLIAYPTN